MWYQDETGMIVINARLPPEEGALVIRALEIIQAENRRKKEEVEEKVNEKEKEKEKEKEETTGEVTGVDETTNEQSPDNKIEVNVDSTDVSAETFSQGMSRCDHGEVKVGR
jgi:hypothetical protein